MAKSTHTDLVTIVVMEHDYVTTTQYGDSDPSQAGKRVMARMRPCKNATPLNTKATPMKITGTYLRVEVVITPIDCTIKIPPNFPPKKKTEIICMPMVSMTSARR